MMTSEEQKTRSDSGKPASEKTRALMASMGIVFDPAVTQSRASKLIAEKKRENALSLAEIQAFDPAGGRGSTEYRKYFCPKCSGKAGSRSLSVNESKGTYKCFSCEIKGQLRESITDDFRPSSGNTPQARMAAAILRPEPFDTIPADKLASSVADSARSSFVQFLVNQFGKERALPAVDRYRLGYFAGFTTFWQVDHAGQIRTAHLIRYDRETGKRDKSEYGQNWIHAKLKAGNPANPADADYETILDHKPAVPDNFRLAQCFFGEHLLRDPQISRLPIAILESEKSAVIASIMLPNYLWLASCGKDTNTKPESFARLGHRRIILVPDVDAFDHWQEKARQARSLGLDVKVLDFIQRIATQAQRDAKADLADLLIDLNRQAFQNLLASLPEDDRETLIERAASMEIDGEMSRPAAEWAAAQEWKKRAK